MKTKKELEILYHKIYSQYQQIDEVLPLVEKTQKNFKSIQKEFLKKKKHLHFFKENCYYIAFLGPYSAGKSTFINALLERNILPEAVEKATTAFPTYIKHTKEEKTESVKIVYYSEEERNKLKQFYIHKISEDLNKEEDETNHYLQLPLAELSVKLEEEEKQLNEDKIKYKKDYFIALNKLITQWKNKVDHIANDSVDKISSLIEDSDESIIIKEATVYLNNFSFSNREDIVLVDLPGVDAHNPRHYKVTEDFTINYGKANAYIIVTSPNKIQSDRFVEFLSSLGKHTNQVDKSFWVINQCDTLNDTPEIDVINSLKETVSNCSINIIENRLFTCSAKSYKEKQDTSYTKSIDRLREKLTFYLADTFEKEVLGSVERDYLTIKNKLSDFIAPYLGNLRTLEGKKRDIAIRLKVVQNEIDLYKSQLAQNLALIKEEIASIINTLSFFDSTTIESLKKKLSTKFDLFIDYTPKILIDDSRDSMIDQHEKIIRLIQDEITLNEYIRAELDSALEKEGKLSCLTIPKSKLLENTSEYVESLFVSKKIDPIINLKERLGGVSDVMLKNYNDIFEETIRLTIPSSENLLKARLFFHYKDNLSKRLRHPQPQQVHISKRRQSILDYISLPDNKEVIQELINAIEPSPAVIGIDRLQEYKVELLKVKMLKYLDDIKISYDENIRVCLINYYKIHFKNLSELVFDKELIHTLNQEVYWAVEENGYKIEDTAKIIQVYGDIYDQINSNGEVNV